MISVVIPLHNEKDSLNPLHEELIDVLNSLNREYEIIFIDDGSTDNSISVLMELQSRDSNTRCIQFKRNYGQTAALVAGIQGQLWSETLTNPNYMDFMINPRLAALSEVAWSSTKRRSWKNFRSALLKATKLTHKLGWNCHEF